MQPQMVFKLHPKQMQCFTSPATEILYGGAAGGGKSHFMRVNAIFWAYEVPGVQIYIFRRTSPELYHNYLKGASSFHALLAEDVQRGEVSFAQKPNMHFKFKNGSTINLCHCQYEDSVFTYQGAEIHILMIDELTHFSASMYKYLTGRVRVAKSGDDFSLHVPQKHAAKIPFIVTASNPGGVGHSWVKNEFVDIQAPGEIMRMDAAEGGFLRQYIPARLDDNPSLSYDEYAATLSGLGEELKRALLEGDWNIVAGGMFDDVFKSDVHVLPAGVLPKPHWPVWKAYDFGSSRPWCVLWFTEVQDGFVYEDRYIPHKAIIVFNEIYGVLRTPSGGFKANVGDRATPVTQALRILNAEIHAGVDAGASYADPAIFARTQASAEQYSSIADIFRECGIEWWPASNERKAGWYLIRTKLQGTEGIPMLYFSESCKHLLRLLPQMPRDMKDPEDIDTDAEDHPLDTLRYGLLSKNKPSGEDINYREFRALRKAREMHNFASRFDPTYIPYDLEMEGDSANAKQTCVGYTDKTVKMLV